MDQIEGANTPQVSEPIEMAEGTNIASTEKMLPQSQVDQLIKSTKLKAYQRGKEEVLAEMQQLSNQAAPVQSQSPSLGGIKMPTQEDFRRMIAEEARKMAYEQTAHQMINNLASRIEVGKTKYDSKEFEEAVDGLNLSEMGPILKLMGDVDNPADILMHLWKHPSQLTALEGNAEKRPGLARKSLLELSQSLKEAETAENTPTVPEPISQIKRSTVGADNKVRDVDYFRNLHRRNRK